MRTFLLVPLLALVAAAGEPTDEGVGLTIYSSPGGGQPRPPVWNPRKQVWEQASPGFAVVKERRRLRLAGGAEAVRFTDVAALIDPTSVHFVSLTDPAGTYVLEQNFEYDLVSGEKLLQKFLDRTVEIEREKGEILSGVLLSADPAQIVLRTADPASPVRILARADAKHVRLPELPGGLITRPTLVWLLRAEKPGDQLAKVTYQTEGMRWNADYTAVIAPGDAALDLAGWVTIHNESGASYRDADLKLVAGDIHRATESGVEEDLRFARAEAKSEGDAGGFQEKAFFEYHLYTLGRKTSLADRAIKQIELFDPVQGVPARKIFLYYGGVGGRTYGGSPYFDRNFGISSNRKVDIHLEFRNAKEGGMGMPLPAGRVRVYKKDDADGSLELIGEDRIDHTPKDEKVRLTLGSAFDIVGERKQTDFRMDERAHWIRESFEIRIRNHKTEAVEVIVKENLYRWSNWEIEKKSHAFTKEDARTIHFPVAVPPDGETVVTYTALYTW